MKVLHHTCIAQSVPTAAQYTHKGISIRCRTHGLSRQAARQDESATAAGTVDINQDLIKPLSMSITAINENRSITCRLYNKGVLLQT